LGLLREAHIPDGITVQQLLLLFAAWIATWGTSPVFADAERSFSDATLRQVVHVSIGASSVRVRFTNRFGSAPLRIAAAAICLERDAATPVRGSIRRLTFGGSSSVTIAPHADANSDAARLNVAPRGNLLVDIYVPGSTGPATAQNLSYQTNYAASGNHTGESSPKNFTQTFTSWYFLAAVEAGGTRARGAVVAFGDSITVGAGGVPGANDRWPDFLAARLLALPPRRQLGVVNAGISGNRILLGDPRYGLSALARLDSDVLSQSGVTDAIVMLGINDIQQTPHQYDPIQIERGLTEIAVRAHARHVRVIAATITPYEGWLTYAAPGEATRIAVNEFIRQARIFDGIADFDEALRDPGDPHRLLPAYDSGDHLHPNAAAHRVMAGAVALGSL
jgi:lysophospholipase L1-like esterase